MPEVETLVRELRPKLIGKVINGLVIKPKCWQYVLQEDPHSFYQKIIGEEIVTVLRKGKYILIPLTNNNVIVIHLGMTGKLLIKPLEEGSLDSLFSEAAINKHTHLVMDFINPYADEEEEDISLHFNDVRMFGNIWVAENVGNIEQVPVPGLKDLGPDALGMSLDEFRAGVKGNRSVKSLLLDQTKVAGVGNIYADEALFSAKIHPAIKAKALTEDQLARLWFAVKSVLKQGIQHKGSSVSDYTDAYGIQGSFQNYHRVYGKAGQGCTECTAIIERIKVAGRSTHFCPSCQKGG